VRGAPSICPRKSCVKCNRSDSIRSRQVNSHRESLSSILCKRLQTAVCEVCTRNACTYFCKCFRNSLGRSNSSFSTADSIRKPDPAIWINVLPGALPAPSRTGMPTTPSNPMTPISTVVPSATDRPLAAEARKEYRACRVGLTQRVLCVFKSHSQLKELVSAISSLALQLLIAFAAGPPSSLVSALIIQSLCNLPITKRSLNA